MRHFDHTDHARNERRTNRKHRHPDPEAIKYAEEELKTHDLPGTPKTGAAQIVANGLRLPRTFGTRYVEVARITKGNPEHGELRSEDHIGKYVVIAPWREFEDAPQQCPECGGYEALYDYDTYHFIAGYETVSCADCDYVHEDEQWG